MNKSELIEKMAEAAGLPKATAAKALDAFTQSIEDALNAGDSVTIVGFGSFSVRERRERTVTNPKTKQKQLVPATKVPVFKAGKTLKDAVSSATSSGG